MTGAGILRDMSDPKATQKRKEASLLATAAWTSLQAQCLAYYAEAMRAAGPETLDEMRHRAHHTLDAVLDLNAEAGQHVRDSQLG